MRFVPGTSRALFYRWAQKQSGSSSMNALPAALMFFDGTMPDAATIRQRFAAGMTSAPRQANLYNVISPHQSQYMGFVGWRYGIISALAPDINEIDLNLNYQGDTGMTSPTPNGYESDPIATRQARIHRAGKPTWFALAVTSGSGYLACNSDTIPVLNNGNQIYIAALGTVGDEDSTADLKLVGGNLALTQTTPVDLSKSPIIANLRLRLR
ncbi:hypothetical protein JA13_073 [Dickeya phage vB_DsoM_JA13]|uniref:Uncharacterized protein n=1 Tax=Dickeya phage vB_DsoM_JA13 TaxID=2283030 RepID=A0A384ZW70_9CAUD|nr:hypothetical protein JA13_073 [Dickeya phage vB_DsoM_JA13]